MNLETIPTIYCDNCGQSFMISRNRIIEDNYSVFCPYCNTQMDEQMAHKVVSAIGEVMDVNIRFKDEGDEPLFQLGIQNSLPKNVYYK